ncbi:MFS transporter [Vibrio cholerae]|uniref:MFS transporter n=1 Tax=Vibrio cholerae TaxID=666 RepID=UPI001158EB76|nr:MFS transporter [Vibrio cholerae]EHU8077116.1 MFS transporter [Vibrio cholerae]EHV9953270.1 MFS transporter [Vibrio cholerae]ELG4676624.1 MFS transporter [Vibrio cholerae]TQQ04262.1 MFS transporter [Vibrio cholerae]
MLVQEFKDKVELFENKPYLYFTLSGLFATLGNGLNYITLSWLAYNISDSISGVAMMMFFIWMPSILFAPILGTMADRYNRKALMTISNIARGIAVVAYVVLWHQDIHIDLMFLCAIIGVFISFYMPAAVPFIQSIVPKEKLLRANATIDMVYEFGTIIGMGISGILITTLGIKNTLMTGGFLFILAGVFNLLIKSPKQKNNNEEVKQSWWQDYCDSLRYFRQNPHLFAPYLNQMLIMVLLMTIPVILVPYTKEVLNASTRTFSIYEALYAMGVLLGGFLSPILCRKLTTRYTLVFLLAIMAVGLYILSINTSIGLVFPIYFMIGFGISSWALSITLAQLACNPDYQGRLQATFNGISGAFILVLYLLIASQGSSLSSQHIYLMQSVLAICGITFILLLNKGSDHEY